MRKLKQGGAREGAGRKPLPKNEKRVTVSVYVKGIYIDAVGGLDAAKNISEKAILKASKLPSPSR